MSDGQALLERCLLLPCDANARNAIADWIAENGDLELAAAMRHERGVEYLCITRNLANRQMRFPCLKFLWAVVFVFSVEEDRRQAEGERLSADLERAFPPGPQISLGEMVVLPQGMTCQPAPRERVSFVRRLLGGR